jgi:hypothetical protein
MLILNMALYFTFVCNLENLQCDSPNSPPIHAFTHHVLILLIIAPYEVLKDTFQCTHRRNINIINISLTF